MAPGLAPTMAARWRTSGQGKPLAESRGPVAPLFRFKTEESM